MLKTLLMLFFLKGESHVQVQNVAVAQPGGFHLQSCPPSPQKLQREPDARRHPPLGGLLLPASGVPQPDAVHLEREAAPPVRESQGPTC
ncbi:MAG: hypothetical protein [Microviridae sp.]|nr:MAG: hypothetical protein [Microviridae sp.]